MLSELIVLSLASSIGWELIRYFYPGKINVRIAPALVVIVSFLFTFAFSPSIIMSFASAGGVALFHIVTKAYEAAPPQLVLKKPDFKIKDNIPYRSSHRIPDL